MADLGLFFGQDEDDAQLEQEDKDLSYLVLSSDQDDNFDGIDTEALLAEMSEETLVKGSMDISVETDVVQLFADPNLSAVEKAQLLSKSDYDFHRAFFAREVATLLPMMDIRDAISCIIPIVHAFSIDPQESVRESLASQLDKIVLFFFQNTFITYEPLSNEEQHDKVANTQYSSMPAPLQHDIFTPIFIKLLLDQSAGIAHQTREAVKSVAENVSEQVLESEILNGVIAGLETLYNAVDIPAEEDQGDQMMKVEPDQDGEAELGKMLVVVLLTSLAQTLGKDRCTQFALPKLEKLMSNSQFYVRKEIVIALGKLCRVVDQEVVIDRLLPLYDVFVHDDTWHIRRACCTVLASFVSSLPVEMKTKKVEEIYNLYSVDASRSVRNSIMEVLGEVIAGFEVEKVPDSLLTHFLNMGQQPGTEHELAVMCAFSFPAVILTAGRSKWEQMKPVYMTLAGTFRSPIRRSLACSLHEVARILGPELADRDLAQPFSECLLADDDVKEGVIGHVVEFVSCLSPKCRSEALRGIFNAWIELERSSNWRLRDSLAGQLPALCEIAEGKDLLEYLMPLSIRACTDGVSTIRESGVMSFPALWEASSRIGPFVHKKQSQGAAASDEEESVFGSFGEGEGEDVEMEDVTHQVNESSEKTPKTKLDDGNANGVPTSLSFTGYQDDDEEAMTTIKEQVVRQAIEFTTNGGFRSRVVAVQIIQSLLDYGITAEEFQEHFLSLLVDKLATDTVVDVRIWVSRVVSWVIESSLYTEELICNRLKARLADLQKDIDRDVRLYAGGPSELPKLKRKKKKSKSKKKKKKEVANPLSLGSFHQNSDRVLASTISEEDEDGEEVQFLKGEGDSDEDEDEDDDDDDDEDGDSEDDSSDDNMEFLNSVKAKGISNKPRNRNSIGIGMKVMVGNKLTVSGKEIRKPKTSWDYVHGEIDEDEDESSESSQKSFSASLGSKEAQQSHWNQDEDDEDEGESLFDMPRRPLEQDEDDDIVNDSDANEEFGSDHDISRVIPYTRHGANGASPLDVEMEEAFQEGSGERVAVVVSGGKDSALAGQESRSQDPQSCEPSASDVSAKSLPKPSPAPVPSQYLPLTPTSEPTSEPSAGAVLSKTPTELTYAALVKKDEYSKSSATVSRIVGAVTVDAAAAAAAGATATTNGVRNEAAAAGTKGRSPEEEVLRVLNAKLLATGAVKKAHPLLSVNTNKRAAPVAGLAIGVGTIAPGGIMEPRSPSYAAIVASGASSPHPGAFAAGRTPF